ncbi:MAG: methyltransferase domain-containing protein [candidate division FCPU426 bacterium]
MNVKVLHASLEDEKGRLPAADVIVSSMTLHHIPDTVKAARALFAVLNPKGQIAIADLDEHDGGFHSVQDANVHNGFNRQALQKVFFSAGFRKIEFCEAYTRRKQLADGRERDFKIFLMTARKSF